MFEIKGKRNTAICYAKVVEDEAIEQVRRMCDYEITDEKYIMTMEYDKEDGTDILIQVMSFGRFVKSLEPMNLIVDMKKRLEQQLEMLQW